MDFYERYRWAESAFALRDYRGAIKELTALLAELEDTPEPMHGTSGIRELLARAYFHSALLERSEATCRDMLTDNPSDAYAALLLARTLKRQSRTAEAEAMSRLATALGAPREEFSGQPARTVVTDS